MRYQPQAQTQGLTQEFFVSPEKERTMTIYVDELREYHALAGHRFWCHMATDGDIDELHQFAQRIGLKRAWFQKRPSLPHYDLTPPKRILATKAGAVEVTTVQLYRLCREKQP